MFQGDSMALKIRYLLACSAAIVSLPHAALAQKVAAAPGVESVVVTGSRVISDAANSPTPLTIVSTEDLLATTPTDIPDGLNKLPIFQGSQSIGRPGDGSKNFSSNTLNLRNFGAERTLVLLDGQLRPQQEVRRL
jgi:iron complex outermembrane receptor protein